MKMGLFDKIKGSLDNASRYADLRKKIENNEISALTEDDRNFFEITAKKTPEEYLVKYNIKDVTVEVYNTSGYENNGTTVYSLSELEKI